MRFNNTAGVRLCLLSGLLASFSASGQEAQPQGTSSQEPQSVLQEIVVTVDKIRERLQDVPGTVQVLPASTIQDADVSQIGDIVMLTTGLDYEQTFGRQTTNAVIRGVAPAYLIDPSVVTFVDGFSLGFTRRVDNSLLTDLERIEVLKGPQATLYGFDAIGGVINYVTKKPSQTTETYFSGDYGSYQKYKVAAAVSGALLADEQVYGRLSIATRGSGGTVDNLYDGAKDVNPEHDVAARGSLRWVATDALEFNASATYSRVYDGCGDCSHIPPAWNFANRFSFQQVASGTFNWSDYTRTTDMSYLGNYHTKSEEVVLNTTYTQPLFTVTSITGWGDIDSSILGDSLGPLGGKTVGYYVPDDTHGWSEELRIASNGQDRLTWLAGLYDYRSEEVGDTFIFIPAATSLGRNVRTVTDYAAFGNLDYSLSRELTATVGLRYDHYEQRAIQSSAFTPPSSGDATSIGFLPRFSLSFKPNEDRNYYVLAARGSHAGGFNSPNSPIAAYQSEYLWNYEVGFKGSFWDKRLQTQLDAFYYDWTNQQVAQSINLPGQPGVGYIANAGKSRITGEEAALQWAVTNRLNIDGSLTLLDPKYIRYQDPIVAPLFGLSPNLSGNRLPFAPRVSASLSGQYVAPLPLGSGAWQLRIPAKPVQRSG